MRRRDRPMMASRSPSNWKLPPLPLAGPMPRFEALTSEPDTVTAALPFSFSVDRERAAGEQVLAVEAGVGRKLVDLGANLVELLGQRLPQAVAGAARGARGKTERAQLAHGGRAADRDVVDAGGFELNAPVGGEAGLDVEVGGVVHRVDEILHVLAGGVRVGRGGGAVAHGDGVAVVHRDRGRAGQSGDIAGDFGERAGGRERLVGEAAHVLDQRLDGLDAGIGRPRSLSCRC